MKTSEEFTTHNLRDICKLLSKFFFFFQKKKSIKGRSIKGGNKEKKRKECKRFLKECKKYAALNLLYLHSLFSSGSKRCRSCMGSTIAASHSEKRLIKRTWLNRFCNSLSQSPCSFPLRAYCDVEIPGWFRLVENITSRFPVTVKNTNCVTTLESSRVQQNGKRSVVLWPGWFLIRTQKCCNTISTKGR